MPTPGHFSLYSKRNATLKDIVKHNSVTYLMRDHCTCVIQWGYGVRLTQSEVNILNWPLTMAARARCWASTHGGRPLISCDYSTCIPIVVKQIKFEKKKKGLGGAKVDTKYTSLSQFPFHRLTLTMHDVSCKKKKSKEIYCLMKNHAHIVTLTYAVVGQCKVERSTYKETGIREALHDARFSFYLFSLEDQCFTS